MGRPAVVPARLPGAGRFASAGRLRFFGALVFLGAAAILFRRALFLDETFVAGDLVGYARPYLALVEPLWRSSTGLPLWNPFVASGQPFLGNPAQPLLSPLRLLFLAVPFEWAFRLHVVLPPLLSGLGMAFLLRTLGRTRAAALLGALSWGLGGLHLSTAGFLPIHSALFPFPFALAFTHRLARSRDRRLIAGAALSIGLVLLTGEPTAPFALALLLPAALASGLGPRRASRAGWLPRVAPLLLPALVLGAAIGGVTLVPGLHHLGKTTRGGGLPEDHAGFWSLPPARLAELATPSAVARFVDGDWERGGRYYPVRHRPYIASIYPGVVSLLLATTVLARRRRLLPWLAAGLLGLVLAFGTHTPVWALARCAVPFLSAVRYPEKLVAVPLLVLTLVAASGLDLLRVSRRARLTVAGSGVALALAALALVPLTGPGGIAPAPAELVAAALVAALVSALALAARRHPRVAPPLLCLVAAADVVFAGLALVKTAPVAVAARPPAALLAAIAGKLPGPLFVSSSVGDTLPPLEVYSSPVPARWGLSTVLEDDFDQTELRWSVEATRRFYLAVDARPDLLGPLLARRGVAAILRDAPPDGRSRPVLMRTVDRRPLAFFAPGVAFVDGADGWTREVLRLGPLAATTVCLDTSDRAKVGEPSGLGDLVRARVWPDRLVLDVRVRGNGSALLAVNQTWDDTWRASVDGRGTRPLVADLSLLALPVPPGAHRVELWQESAPVKAGLGLTAVSLLLCAGLLARGSPRVRTA